jgi:hypothetical protein
MCNVSGGVTGTREAPLKGPDGVMRFTHREDAEAEAKRQREAKRDSFSTATFRYWVEPEVW